MSNKDHKHDSECRHSHLAEDQADVHGNGHNHDHDHNHNHDHEHEHGHSHGPGGHHHYDLSGLDGEEGAKVLRGLKIAFALNLGFSVFEFIGGYYSNSVAVMSDALHDLGDALALGLAWVFEKKSRQKASDNYSYGYRRYSLLSSVVTGTILLLGSVFIVRESVERIFSPQPVVAWGMIAMSFVGIAVNGWSLLQFSQGGGASEKMLRLHFIEDLAGWILVLLTGTVLQFLPWPWLDAVVGAGLAVWIVINVIRQLISVAAIFLQATPIGMSPREIEIALAQSDSRIQACHHTHLWSLDGQKHIVTTHICVAPETRLEDLPALKAKLKKQLRDDFQVFEATIEFEIFGEVCDVPRH